MVRPDKCAVGSHHQLEPPVPGDHALLCARTLRNKRPRSVPLVNVSYQTMDWLHRTGGNASAWLRRPLAFQVTTVLAAVVCMGGQMARVLRLFAHSVPASARTRSGDMLTEGEVRASWPARLASGLMCVPASGCVLLPAQRENLRGYLARRGLLCPDQARCREDSALAACRPWFLYILANYQALAPGRVLLAGAG